MGRNRRTHRGNGYFWDSAILNKATYDQYVRRLTELSTSMFEWKNLPDTCDERFLEMTLLNNGAAVFFKDEVLGYLALEVTLNGKWNVYRVPIERRAYATNGYNKELTIDNSVIIYNNYIRTNSILDIKMFARRLTELDRAIDVNARAQKHPVLILATEEQRNTMMNIYKEYDGNEPVIFGDKNLDLNGITSINTGAPYVADKLYQLKTDYWNECLTYLGISNVNYQKKERMVSDEVVRSQGGTMASRYSRLEMRRKAAEEINDMFGLNIEVNFREDYREQDDEFMLEQESEAMGDKVMVRDVRTNSGEKE